MVPSELTITGAAKYLGCSVPTLRRWRALDTGPECFIYGGRLVYEVAALDRWVEDCRVATLRGGNVYP